MYSVDYRIHSTSPGAFGVHDELPVGWSEGGDIDSRVFMQALPKEGSNS